MLDAFGTMLALEPPLPRLAAGLEAIGHPHPSQVIERAFQAEVAHYRANHLRGVDPPAVRALRRECAGVMARSLGPGAPAPEALEGVLMDALHFTLAPDAREVLDELAARGTPVALVSNWDASLRGLIERLGVADRFAAICTSAECGFAKPDRRIFRLALARLSVPPECAVHCGDDPLLDGLGAAAAGVTPVILTRSDTTVDRRFRSISRLSELQNDEVMFQN